MGVRRAAVAALAAVLSSPHISFQVSTSVGDQDPHGSVIVFSRLDLDPQWECGSESRRAKKDQRKRKKSEKIHVFEVLGVLF